MSVSFTKTVASGNDFIVFDNFKKSSRIKLNKKIIQRLCYRKFGIGSDGILLLEKKPNVDFVMRIFNPDGSEAEMCGNGIRCAAVYFAKEHKRKKMYTVSTKAGIFYVALDKDLVKVNMRNPVGLKLDIPLNILGKKYNVHFVNTGVPHVVLFCDKLSQLDIVPIAREIRFHKRFKPNGTNVNFVTIENNNNIRIRTYERGVEAETLACGTGSTAAAIITGVLFNRKGNLSIKVKPASKENLFIYYKIGEKKQVAYVWMEGKASIVYKGEVSKSLISENSRRK